MHPAMARAPTADCPLALGSDHAAFTVKERLLAWLRGRGVPCLDLGTHSAERTDYPAYGRRVAEAVAGGGCARGMLFCGTGIGISIAANRVKGARASLCWSVETARLTRDHNDSNILVLPARVPTIDPLEDIAAMWLETPYSGNPSYSARLGMLDA